MSNFLNTCLLDELQNAEGELSWYLGCAFERDRKESALRMSHRRERLSSLSSVGMDSKHCLIPNG